MNAYGTMAGGAALRQHANFDFKTTAQPASAPDLNYLRASGLAQVRLQLAVLSGDRRGALREIDRLVEIDRQLETLAASDGPVAAMLSGVRLRDHLAEQQLAIASEKLALTSGIDLPRLPPSSLPEELYLDEHAEPAVIEDTEMGETIARFVRWGLVGASLLVAISIAVVLLANYRLLPLPW